LPIQNIEKSEISGRAGGLPESQISLSSIFLAAAWLTAGNVDGLERGNRGKHGKIAITMKHRQLVPKRAGSDQTVDPGANRQPLAPRLPVQIDGVLKHDALQRRFHDWKRMHCFLRDDGLSSSLNPSKRVVSQRARSSAICAWEAIAL